MNDDILNNNIVLYDEFDGDNGSENEMIVSIGEYEIESDDSEQEQEQDVNLEQEQDVNLEQEQEQDENLEQEQEQDIMDILSNNFEATNLKEDICGRCGYKGHFAKHCILQYDINNEIIMNEYDYNNYE